MVNMIMDVKHLLNQSCHAWACPKLCGISSVLSAFQQQFFQLRSALSGEFRGASGCRLGLQAFGPVIQVTGLPAANGPAVDFESFCDFNRLESIFKQNGGLQTPLFQLFRAAVWAHGAPPAHSIGHYLYRCQ
ncbi:MAG: hypothetical protein AUJ51_06915 [Elusimicrobia bacterium CG1_02_56_21]|nr:MAG: hypothetical protein AUJ51_06915 [Elusimicrobia bacterium CG1_02_56_21]